jgi:hypothetical protein
MSSRTNSLGMVTDISEYSNNLTCGVIEKVNLVGTPAVLYSGLILVIIVPADAIDPQGIVPLYVFEIIVVPLSK